MRFSIRTRLLRPLAVFGLAPLFGLAQQQSPSKILQQEVTNNSNGNRKGEQVKPTYISGQVALSDGSQPSGRIAI